MVLLCRTQSGTAVWCESTQMGGGGRGGLPKAGLCRSSAGNDVWDVTESWVVRLELREPDLLTAP